MSKQNEFETCMQNFGTKLGTNTCMQAKTMQDKFGANLSIQSPGIEKLIIFETSRDQISVKYKVTT